APVRSMVVTLVMGLAMAPPHIPLRSRDRLQPTLRIACDGGCACTSRQCPAGAPRRRGHARRLRERAFLAVVRDRRQVGLMAEGPYGRLGAVADLHFPEKHLEVRLHRAFADGDLARDELVRVALDEAAEDEVLARRQ